MTVGAISAIGGVGMMGSIAPVASLGSSPISTPIQLQPNGISDVVSLGNQPTKSLFGTSGIAMYDSVNSLNYVQGFVDGAITANAVDPLNKMDEVIAMLLLALLLQQDK